MNSMKNALIAATGALTIMSLTGCLGLTDDSSGSNKTGYMQFVNLVPQSPDIELVVEDESIGDLSFAEASSYEKNSTGKYDIEFNQILPGDNIESFIDDATLKVTKNTLHSYVLYGEADSPSSFEVEIDISDVFDDGFDDGFAMVQFVNLASYGETVDVYILDEDESLVGQTADYSLSYESTSEDIELEEGVYKIVFTESGSDTILAMKNSITVDEGDALSYVFVSYEIAGSEEDKYSIVELNDEGARQLTNESASGNLRVHNAIANADTISIGQGSSTNTITDSLSFGEISENIEIDMSDTYEDVDLFFINEETGISVDSLSVTVNADDNLLILTSGDAESTVTAYDTEEDLRIIDTHAKVLVSHSLDSESAIDLSVLIIEEGSNPDSYDSSDAIGYLTNLTLEIEQGDYDVYVYDADTGDLITESTLYDVENGDVINMIVTDYELGGSPYQIYSLVND